VVLVVWHGKCIRKRVRRAHGKGQAGQKTNYQYPETKKTNYQYPGTKKTNYLYPGKGKLMLGMKRGVMVIRDGGGPVWLEAVRVIACCAC
jgi:hypothetical protein